MLLPNGLPRAVIPAVILGLARESRGTKGTVLIPASTFVIPVIDNPCEHRHNPPAHAATRM